jgi:hypothetical protein
VSATLAALWDETCNTLTGIFEAMEWVEDELARAAKRYPSMADDFYHSFSLCRPTESMPLVEEVVRSHARELLERVAQGANASSLRAGTSAEVCVALMEVSQATPMHGAAVGLYLRTFRRAFPTLEQPGLVSELNHYQALHGEQMDDLETETRLWIGRHVVDEDVRRVADDCPGRHHGEPRPDCRFHVPAQVEQLELIA